MQHNTITARVYIRNKQNVRDKIGPLENSAGNIITQGFLKLLMETVDKCVFKRRSGSY